MSSKYRNEVPTIPDYYTDKTIFITGASGFIGKILIEKLLRSCPGIKKIYVVLRSKKDVGVQQRLEEIYNTVLFEQLKRLNPNFFRKLEAVEGDVSFPDLGLSSEDKKKIVDETDIVFHIAANVRFDATLRSALLLNSVGALNVITLASEIKHLSVYLHVSTTYCQSDKRIIEEKIYPAPANWKSMINLARTLDEHTLEIFKEKILGSLPNTYTFSKSLAEHIVNDYRAKVPGTIIFRPSIVISTMDEPISGWMDNFNGPVSLILAMGKGIVRSIHTYPHVRSDYMPADVAVKAMITTVWARGTGCISQDNPEDVEVVNCSSAELNTVTHKDIFEMGLKLSPMFPLSDTLWVPGGTMTSCRYHHLLNVILFQVFPALAVDTYLKATKRDPMLLKLQRRIFVAVNVVKFFIINEWNFRNDKLVKLVDNMHDEDKKSFDYLKKDYDAFEYFRNALAGGRKYLLNEDSSSLPAAKRHYFRMYWLDFGLKCCLLFSAAYWSYKLGVISYFSSFLRDFFKYFY